MRYLTLSGPVLACVASVSWRGSSRKLGQEQKKLMQPFFCFGSNFRAITRLETLATQASPVHASRFCRDELNCNWVQQRHDFDSDVDSGVVVRLTFSN